MHTDMYVSVVFVAFSFKKGVYTLNLKQTLTEKVQVSCSESVRVSFFDTIQIGTLPAIALGHTHCFATPRPVNILIP